MDISQSQQNRLFAVAIVLSIAIHAGVFMYSGIVTGFPDASVIKAPNRPEINVLPKPLISVLEDEIVTEEIVKEPINSDQEMTVSLSKTNPLPKKISKTTQPSVEQRGAITDAKPLLRSNPAPVYPEIARENGWEGTVRLNALIETDGLPHDVAIERSSGYGVLDDAALRTVKKWKFSPAQAGKLKLSSKISIPIRFELISEN